MLTLRYMTAASIAVPLTFVLFANLLGDRLGLRAVAVAWAVGYPLAFAVLSYLVVQSIRLPVRDYLRAIWTVAVCAGVGFALGLGVSLVTRGLGDGVRFAAMTVASLGGMFGLLAVWQGVTPRSIAAAIKG